MPETSKSVKKPKVDPNRQVIPKLSAKLQAKFAHLPSAGGSMKRNSDTITPFTTFPQATYGGSSSSSNRVTTAASALLASARAEVAQVMPDVAADRPPDNFPGKIH